jgi:hypothetical protein
MSQHHLLALYNNFDEAEAVIKELRAANIKGFDFKDLTLKSPSSITAWKNCWAKDRPMSSGLP